MSWVYSKPSLFTTNAREDFPLPIMTSTMGLIPVCELEREPSSDTSTELRSSGLG